MFYNQVDNKQEQERILSREEVDPSLTWDLSKIYAGTEEWEADYREIQVQIKRLRGLEADFLKDADHLLELINGLESCARLMAKLYSYASMLSDQDKANSEHTRLEQRARQLYSEFSSAIAFYQPAILALGEEKLAALTADQEKFGLYQHSFDELFRAEQHTLSSAEEEILAKSDQVLNSGSQVFSSLNNADLKFPDVEDELGQTKPLDHSKYANYLESQDRVLRKNTFTAYYKVYGQFENTLAMTLSSQIKRDNLMAELRGFKSALEAAVFSNAIDIEVPLNLIQTVNQRLPLLHRFVSLKKTLAGLYDLHSYDLYLPAFVAEERKYTLEEAKQIIIDAVAPLGKEYQDITRRAFAESWIDFALNRGKRSGAYSGGCYDTAPYILMSWQGSLANLFTLTHELGHSCHSYLTRNSQAFVYGNYPIFLAEIASTTNENLLTKYLLKHETDPELLNYLRFHWLDRFKSTVFRQTQFAEFEHLIHQADQQGEALTASYLKDQYASLNRRYYGPDLVHDQEISLEWARIPHFYYNYYVYQYATGFSAAVSFADLIEQEGPEASQRYLDFLRSGSSDYPLEILSRAGLDMRKPDAVIKALDRFDQELTEMEKIVAS